MEVFHWTWSYLPRFGLIIAAPNASERWSQHPAAVRSGIDRWNAHDELG
jgi:hypothetical protein